MVVRELSDNIPLRVFKHDWKARTMESLNQCYCLAHWTYFLLGKTNKSIVWTQWPTDMQSSFTKRRLTKSIFASQHYEADKSIGSAKNTQKTACTFCTCVLYLASVVLCSWYCGAFVWYPSEVLKHVFPFNFRSKLFCSLKKPLRVNDWKHLREISCMRGLKVIMMHIQIIHQYAQKIKENQFYAIAFLDAIPEISDTSCYECF